jgi:serine protease AprX
MVRNKFLCFLFLTGLSVNSFSQANRYMVFFTDKNDIPYNINAPQEFLSERSCQRRVKQNIPVSENDLPVKQEYIDSVISIGAVYMFPTKWMNGVLVQCTDSILQQLTLLSFVRKTEYVAPGPKPPNSVYLGTNDNTFHNHLRSQELKNAQQNNMLGIGSMHSAGITGEGILIAVLDAGFEGVDNSIYFNHLMTGNKIIGKRDFVSGSTNVFSRDHHGTEVLSCISAFNAGEYEGTAYNASFVLCITEDVPTEYRVEEYNWLFGAEYADSIGADIINSSLGYNTFDTISMNYTYNSMDGNSAVCTRAADLAASKGILCVISVGNEGFNSWRKLVAPADADSVIAVGAVTSNLQHASFSSYGPSSDGRIKPEVAALGYGTAIIGSSNSVVYGNGTSYSAPLISGLAAGIWQAYPDLSIMELREVIIKGSSQYNNPDTLIGYGIPDYNVIRTLITSFSEELPGNYFRVYPNPVQHGKLFIEYDKQLSGRRMNIEMFNSVGKSFLNENPELVYQDNKIELDLTNLSSGIYVLCLNVEGKKGKVKILIP